MNSYVETQTELGKSSTRRLPDIDYFRSKPLLPATRVAGDVTSAAAEVLASSYWTGRVVQGILESSSGKRITLADYLANPG